MSDKPQPSKKAMPLRPEDYLALAVAHKPHNTPETNCRTCRMIATIADLNRKLELAGLEAEVLAALDALDTFDDFRAVEQSQQDWDADRRTFTRNLALAIKNRDAAQAGGKE